MGLLTYGLTSSNCIYSFGAVQNGCLSHNSMASWCPMSSGCKVTASSWVYGSTFDESRGDSGRPSCPFSGLWLLGDCEKVKLLVSVRWLDLWSELERQRGNLLLLISIKIISIPLRYLIDLNCYHDYVQQTQTPDLIKNMSGNRMVGTSYLKVQRRVLSLKSFKQLQIYQQGLMSEEYVNCPTSKDIDEHFKDQVFQLGLKPKNAEDQRQLMDLLNKYLGYPDDELANNHRLANKLGMLDVQAEHRQYLAQSDGIKGITGNVQETRILKLHKDTCHCCGFFVQPDDVSACSVAPKNIKNFGVANYIFFQTFCYLSVLLLVMLLVYSVFAFATNVSVAKSTNYLNNYHNIDYLSISLGAKSIQTVSPNKDGQTYYFVSAWLGVAMLLVWACVFGCIRKQISAIEYNASRKLRISDFSVVIENVPTDFTKSEIQANFDRYLKERISEDFDKEIRLRNIEVVTYNEGKPFYLDEKEFGDKDLSDLLGQREKLKDIISTYVVQYRRNGEFLTPRGQRTFTYTKFEEVQIAKKKKYQEILARMRQKLEAKLDANRTVAFVTFATHEQRNFVLGNNQNSLFYKLKRGIQFWKDTDYFTLKKGTCVYDDMTIEVPPEPEDINWGNLGLTYCQKFLRMCLTFFVSLLLVGVSLLIVYGLSTVQKNNQNQRFISILISLAISLINLLIVKVIQFMTVYEMLYSMNNYQIGIAIKSVIVQLINSIAVPILVNNLLKDGNVFGRSGLIEDIFVLSIASSFVAPIVRLVDPWNLLLILRAKYYGDEERRLYINQYEYNQICEKMQFQIGLQYIYVIHNFIFVCFFVSLQPIIPLFAMLGLFFMYWIERYSLYSRCQRPVPGPDTITTKLYQIIFFGGVAFALGNLTWSSFLPDKGFQGAILPNLIALGIGLIIFIFPYEKITHIEAIREEKNYFQKRIYFPSEYDRLNPSTSRQAIEQYRAFLMSKKADLDGGNQQLQAEIAKGFNNLSQNNFYKQNYMNRLSKADSDLAIQQIFYNQSKNVVNPQQLYQALMPLHRSQHVPKSNHNNGQNQYPELRGGRSLTSNKRGFIRKIGQSKMYQESSNQLYRDPQHPIDPKDVFQDDIANIYRSNINLGDLGREADHPNIPMTGSRLVPEDRRGRPN